MDTILHQLIFFAFFQALLLLVIYTISPKRRAKFNSYLLVLVVVLLIGLSGRIFHIVDLFGGSRRWVGLSEFSILFFGPTVYLFTLSVLSHRKLSRTDIIHYVPGMLYSLIITVYYLLPPAKVINARVVSGELFRVINILVGTGLVVNISYYVLSVLKYRNYRQDLQAEVSYDVSIRFLYNLLIAIGVCLGVWLTIYLVSIFGIEGFEREFRGIVWISVALIMLFISYYHMASPQVLSYRDLISDQKYVQSKFSAADLEKLKLELDRIMIEKKPYLNQKLMKAELATLLGVSNPEMARLLNERIGMNFFEYINYHRIQEFIKLTQQENASDYTFFGLAQEAGFNSKATFNKSFKTIMGCSPTAYLNK